MWCHDKSVSHFNYNQVGECCTMMNPSCFNFSNLNDIDNLLAGENQVETDLIYLF